ncbi:SDR family oxidoreductase [Streptomyces rimosus]|uniref:SDR family oxidoreductase n=1 Tax=Streptomyces rimosus TaxID=1927 RepID=UPI0004C49D65|nr:SDR family oxidoreductase [Streptomyces rimosus]
MTTAPVVLLTGASGVVGSALLRTLAGQGAGVIALTHHKPAAGRAVRGDITRPWLGLPPAEYRELAATVDVVLHCAARVSFGATARSLHRVNVRGVGHVLRFVEDAGARLVHGSTAFIARNGPDTALAAYADSKAAGETLVRESGLPAAVARISTVIGDTRTGELARLQAFHQLVGMAMWGQLPFLPCETGTRVDMVPVDVVAAALAALAGDEDARGDYWLTAGPAALPMRRIIDVGYEVAAARMSADRGLPDVDLSLLKPHLIEPDAFDAIVSGVLTAAGADHPPSVFRHITGLMAAFNGFAPFPTSLGAIREGPPALSDASAHTALRATLQHLATLPRTMWGSRQ